MKKILILIADGFESGDLDGARSSLIEKGFEVEIAAKTAGPVKGWRHKEFVRGPEVKATIAISSAKSEHYEAVVLPGGQLGADELRTQDDAIRLVRHFYDERKVVAAAGYSAWLLIEANIVKGHEVTSCPSLKTDMINAGAEWIDDASLVTDEGLITFRKTGSWNDFSESIFDEIRKAQKRQKEFEASYGAVLEAVR